jgi:hypothetical protein
MKSENIKISKRHYQTEQVSTINNCAIAWKLNIQLALQLFPIKSTQMSGTSTAACRFRILGLRNNTPVQNTCLQQTRTQTRTKGIVIHIYKCIYIYLL